MGRADTELTGQEIRRNRKKKKKKRRILIIVAILLILGAVAVNAVMDMRITDIGDEDVADMTLIADPDSEYSHLYEDSNRINVLVLGVNPPLADTIMLASYDKKTQDTYIMSIPRDTYYVRNESDTDTNKKINASYKDGVEGIAKAVSKTLCDIPIHYYAVVEYDDVVEIVDAMGGVPVTVPFHMYYNDPWDNYPVGLHIDIPEGEQVLDGETSVEFLRFRHGDPGYPSYPMQDLGRVQTQQAFVKSAIKQSIGFDLPAVAKTAYKTLESNMTVRNMTSLLTSAVGMTGENIQTGTMPGDIQQGAPYFYYPKTEEIEKLITGLYAPPEEETDGTDGGTGDEKASTKDKKK